MKAKTPQQRFAIKDKKKKQLASAYPDLKPQSGIYMFYRIIAYIGKSAEKDGILGRCASHCVEHQQHIDNSIHSRKLSYEGGQWFIKPLIYCLPNEVDKYEREFIEKYNGVYELLNKESGGCQGKELINERKEPKGYKKGVAYGRKKQLDEIRVYFEKYLDFSPKNQNKVTLRKFEEFRELIGVLYEKRKTTIAEVLNEVLKNSSPTFDKDGKPISKLNSDFLIKMCKKYKVEI